jgi:Glycosyl transferase family 2
LSGEFSVTAILATYNEEDIVGQLVADLVDQGIRVYLLDHGSTDATVAEATRGGRDGLLGVERLALEDFALESIVRRKQELAGSLPGSWFINQDADEFREGPWIGANLFESIRRVDALGYNAIDFEVFNFWPTHDRFRKGDDVRAAFTHYERAGSFDKLQIRCWKRVDGPFDLTTSAGHESAFPGRSVFPLRFLLRHYPIRSQEHGERKIFRERRPRYAPAERERGWHVQYDGIAPGHRFIRDPATLVPFDPVDVRIQLALRHRGVEALEGQLEIQLEEAAERLQIQCDEAAQRRAQLEAQFRAEIEAHIEAHGRDRQRLERDLEAKALDIARLQESRDSDRRALAEAEAEIAALRARLFAVLSSLSWRTTTPVRAALDLFRR